MKSKTIITTVLLAFVGVSVVYLVIKESGDKSRAAVTTQTDHQNTTTVTQTPAGSEQQADTTESQAADTKPQNSVPSEEKIILLTILSQIKMVIFTERHGPMACLERPYILMELMTM